MKNVTMADLVAKEIFNLQRENNKLQSTMDQNTDSIKSLKIELSQFKQLQFERNCCDEPLDLVL